MDVLLKYFSDFTQEQLKQFEALDAVYREWNEKINVISRKDIDNFYTNHVLHSLSIAATIQFKDGVQIVDIGTGGGFPGVPLAVFFPNVRFHLVDSIGKKLKVVEAAVDALGLKNVTTQHTRAEDIKNRKFDFAVSRAVAPLKELWSWAQPLINKGREHDLSNGLICLKGGDLTQEIHDSHLRPNVVSVESLFNEPHFKDKYVLHVKR